jgi:hypothetical protein
VGDWAEESSRMSHIYANVAPKMAASAADEPTEGFLGVRRNRTGDVNPTAEPNLPLRIQKDFRIATRYSRLSLN